MIPDKKAIIILGHGSRVPDASYAMQEVAKGIQDKHGYSIIEICYMSRLGPHFDETFDKCVERGATEVILVPYFLHEGLHMKVDIPTMMQCATERHPRIRLVLGKPLGYDEVLIELVHRRICESEALCDVRDLTLPSEDDFPLPQGQCEFVPMTPKQASQWERLSHVERLVESHVESHIEDEPHA